MLSDEDEKELWEERAAIREYLGGYTREQAELLAYEDVQQMLRENENGRKDEMDLRERRD